MAESAHTSQTPTDGDEDNGTAVTTGCKYVFAKPGVVSAIRWWAPATNTGTYTLALYEVTNTNTGTLLASASVESTGVTGGAWNNTPITAQSVSPDKTYVAARHSTSGRFVRTAGVFTAAGITNGNVTAIANGTDSPGPGGALLNCTYDEDAALGYPASQFGEPDYFVDVLFDVTARRRRVTTYARGTEGRLNDILTVLGTTTPSLWPFWEPTGVLVTGISVGDLVPSETAGAAEALEDDFAPLLLPSGLYSYHFHPTGDHHLAGIDSTNYSFGDGTIDSPFSCGAWIRPNAIVTNVIMGKYDSAGGAEEWRFFIDSSGKLSLELHDASASTTEIAASTAALTIGQWVFVVATYDGGETAPVVNLYVDATLANDGSTTESGAYVAMENTASPLTIGCSGVTATPVAEFHGRIALPFITGKALTAAEVTSLYRLTVSMVGIA